MYYNITHHLETAIGNLYNCINLEANKVFENVCEALLMLCGSKHTVIHTNIQLTVASTSCLCRPNDMKSERFSVVVPISTNGSSGVLIVSRT